MSHQAPSRFLRLALLGDAAATAGTGLLMATGAGLLEPWFGLPAPLVRPLGLLLLPFAAFVAWLGTREAIKPALVWTVVVVNALWVVDSAVLLLWPTLSPTGLGQLFVAAQAAAVAAFALAQGLGARDAAQA